MEEQAWSDTIPIPLIWEESVESTSMGYGTKYLIKISFFRVKNIETKNNKQNLGTVQTY